MALETLAPRAAVREVPLPRDTKTTVNCYTLFDKFFPQLGMLDYTEGIYRGDPQTPFDVAQRNQIDYVLDQVQCGEGTRILEIGCGNGKLLDVARERGADAVGITISPEQVALCRQRDLNVLLLDYRDLPEEWNGRFDAVVANGPMEHFVRASDAAAGWADEIYRRCFATCRRMIDEHSPVRRFINTTIHFLRVPKAENLMRHPLAFRPMTDAFHWSMLERSFGGFYPELGQFERCAQGNFELIETVDGTEDYHWTSEAWLVRVRGAVKSRYGLGAALRSLPFGLRHPHQLIAMLSCMLVSESWNWQFRGPNAPTCLLRQTWRAV
jgi:cyclopropane-fatty-acyl-phospholipid synthase